MLLLLACGGDPLKLDGDVGGDTGPIGYDGEETGEGEDTETETSNPASISGTVTVLPVSQDETGATVVLTWEEANGGVYPYGKIWVDTYTIDPMSRTPDYGASVVIMEPTTGANPWTMDLNRLRRGEIMVQAMVDYWNDGVIGTGEPSAIWHEPLALTPGEIVDDIDLYVTVQWPIPTGGGTAPPSITLTGDAAVDTTSGSPCLAALFYTSGAGPVFWSWFANVSGDPPWSTYSYADWGDMTLSGACDVNRNTLIEPSDHWGTWVVEGQDANPVEIEDENLSGMRLEIPFEGAYIPIDPIVTLSGQVVDENGFDAYPDSAVLYVIAQHTLRNADFTTDDFVRDYDYQAFSGSDLTGSALDFELTVPPYKDVYLWAWVDLDGDGNINEAGEPVGSGPGGMGKIYSSDSYEDLVIEVQYFEEPTE